MKAADVAAQLADPTFPPVFTLGENVDLVVGLGTYEALRHHACFTIPADVDDWSVPLPVRGSLFGVCVRVRPDVVHVEVPGD